MAYGLTLDTVILLVESEWDEFGMVEVIVRGGGGGGTTGEI